MAFPVIASQVTTVGNVDVNTIDIDVPPDMENGDGLLVIVIANYRKVTEWGPFTSIGEFGDASGYASVGQLVWDGTHTSPITVELAGTCTPIALALRLESSTIEGWSIQPPVANGHAVASSTTPAQPKLTVPWGVAENLWLSIFGMVTNNVSVDGRPVGWTLVEEEFSNEPDSSFSVSKLESASDEEQPGNYTISPGNKSLGVTLGIAPSLLSDFPVIDGTSKKDDSAAAEMVIPLPPNIVAGDGLLIIFSTTVDDSISDWDGFTELVDYHGGAGSTIIAYKMADGTEGSTITIQAGTANWKTALVVKYKAGTFGDFSAFPPEFLMGYMTDQGGYEYSYTDSLVPSWGEASTGWLAGVASHASSSRIDDIFGPPSYAALLLAQIGTSSGLSSYVAKRNLFAASELPGQVTFTGDNMGSVTHGFQIAIAPGMPAGGFEGFGAVNI